MFFYSLLLGAGLAVSSPWWLARMMVTSRYRQGLRQRLGHVPVGVREAARGKQVVWLHAVSVGEVLAAALLVHELEKALNASPQASPNGGAWRVLVSTTTQTGQALARERFGQDRVFWFPLDFGWAVRAWMRALRPRMVVLMESELWPRLLAECGRANVPVAVVNARMSDRSFRRARQVRRVWIRVLRGVSLFLAQGEETGARLQALGVSKQRIAVPGNLKYDLEPRETAIATALRPMLHRRLLVVGGSLLAPEEKLLLERWPTIHERVPGAILLLAPRHPERFGAVAKLVSAAGPLYRASELAPQRGAPPGLRLDAGAVVLLDTVGDLASVYGLADVAFVGGSLARKGGHNPLEPARFGVPVVMGTSFENFREIVMEMQAVAGIQIVQSGEEMGHCLLHLLTHRVEADAMGQRGHRIFENKRGATQRTVAALTGLLATTETPNVEGGRR